MKATSIGFEVKHVRSWILEFLNLHLGDRECFPLLSGPPTLELKGQVQSKNKLRSNERA